MQILGDTPNAVVQSVTGSGQFTAGGLLRIFAFIAVKRADGTVSGGWQQDNRAANVKTHGDVTCFTIIGTSAWIGGMAKRTDAPPGEVAWRVVDNGQGANAVPDQISLKFAGAGSGFRRELLWHHTRNARTEQCRGRKHPGAPVVASGSSLRQEALAHRSTYPRVSVLTPFLARMRV